MVNDASHTRQDPVEGMGLTAGPIPTFLRASRRRWGVAILLTAGTGILAISLASLRLVATTSEPGIDVSALSLALLVFPLVPIAMTVLFYNLLARWPTTSKSNRSLQVLGLISAGLIGSSAVAQAALSGFALLLALPINGLALAVTISWFPRRSRAHWGLWRYALLAVFIGMVFSVAGCTSGKLSH